MTTVTSGIATLFSSRTIALMVTVCPGSDGSDGLLAEDGYSPLQAAAADGILLPPVSAARKRVAIHHKQLRLTAIASNH